MFGVFAIDEILRYRGTRFPGSHTLCHPDTDQQVTTRLGWVNEWRTDVNVQREGNHTLSKQKVLDETYLFKGSENSLVMTQSYTHDFQCVYQLQRYPFDTQVGGMLKIQTTSCPLIKIVKVQVSFVVYFP